MEKTCFICKKPIVLATPTVEVVGGYFPREEPDFFLADPATMAETYGHRECFVAAVELASRRDKVG